MKTSEDIKNLSYKKSLLDTKLLELKNKLLNSNNLVNGGNIKIVGEYVHQNQNITFNNFDKTKMNIDTAMNNSLERIKKYT
jgi:hypothetical protein